ncbi:MAG: efflux RND transporter permease subunit [Gammaproteobacteria bacterium]|nr:efflux RND transporter permease subunit [Gammaproteobacteria bacterium]MBT8104777.1 efflux RND transporter permease subunit [Gammaproteobacteria bacterium]NNK24791.1 efflux RND transporter permease subunit [Woeseiaceae bacterium]
MFDAFVRNGILVTVAALIISVLGILAALRVPVQMIPDLDVRTVSIQTAWPGATPQDVEKEILIEQEEYLRSLPNLRRLESSSSSGSAVIELDFPFGVDMTQTLIRVNNALNQVPSYPENVDQPRVFASSFSANSFMYFAISPLPGNPRGLDMDMMRDFIVDNVRTRLSGVAGVSEVAVWGGADRQVRILLDPVRLADRQLTILDVRNAIRARNRDVSGGEIDSGKRRYLLRTVGRFGSVEDLSDLIIERRGDALIRLSDVAEVELDHFEIRNFSYFNADRIIALAVSREAGSNVIDIKYDMLDAVEQVKRDVLEPAGMTIHLMAEDAGYVEASVRNVWINLSLGAIFATAVMFLFLRSARATAVGVIGIPICTIAAFIGLLAAGRTINVISLAGVAFAIGMTLDNSIVVIESIELKRRQGLDRFRAAVEGVRSVWTAVLASTLTTILVFLPVLFIQQEAGQLYSDVAIAISASIFASMLVAITLIPTASARLSFGSENRSHGAGKMRDRVLAWIDALITTPRRRMTTILVTVVVSSAVIVGLTPPAEYLPEGEEPKTFAFMSAPPGYNLQTMTEIGLDVRDYFLAFVDDESGRYARGEIDVPPIKYMNTAISADNLRIISEPVHRGDIEALMNAFTERFRQYPGMRAFAARGSIISSNDGGTRSINLDVSGPSLSVIYDAALTVYRRAQDVFENPRIQSNPSSLALSQPLVEVLPDWNRAAELGMEAGEVGYTVAALTDGAFVDEFFEADDKIDMYLYSTTAGQAELDSLGSLPVYTPQGSILPLDAIATITETVDTSTIRRINGRRTVTLNIIPPKTVPLEEGVEIVRQDVVAHLRDSGALPASVNVDISGASDQLDATKAALATNYPVALVIIFLLLVAIFRHWGYPLLIMTTIPLGIAGGIVGLALFNGIGTAAGWIGLGGFHQSFDMITMLGFLILIGTVVNNPILIVDRAMQHMKAGEASALEAVREAVSARLRPIAMSTLTTICGLSPLVFIPGAGTELYRGVGAIVLFGILGAAVVSVTMLPALTIAVLEWRSSKQAVLMPGSAN